MRYDDMEMRKIYEESIQAKDYSGLVFGEAKHRVNMGADKSKIDVANKVNYFNEKAKAAQNSDNLMALNIIRTIAFIIIVAVFIVILFLT